MSEQSFFLHFLLSPSSLHHCWCAGKPEKEDGTSKCRLFPLSSTMQSDLDLPFSTVPSRLRAPLVPSSSLTLVTHILAHLLACLSACLTKVPWCSWVALGGFYGKQGRNLLPLSREAQHFNLHALFCFVVGPWTEQPISTSRDCSGGSTGLLGRYWRPAGSQA